MIQEKLDHIQPRCTGTLWGPRPHEILLWITACMYPSLANTSLSVRPIWIFRPKQTSLYRIKQHAPTMMTSIRRWIKMKPVMLTASTELTIPDWLCFLCIITDSKSMRLDIGQWFEMVPSVFVNSYNYIVTVCVGPQEDKPQWAHPMSLHGRLI